MTRPEPASPERVAEIKRKLWTNYLETQVRGHTMQYHNTSSLVAMLGVILAVAAWTGGIVAANAITGINITQEQPLWLIPIGVVVIVPTMYGLNKIFDHFDRKRKAEADRIRPAVYAFYGEPLPEKTDA